MNGNQTITLAQAKTLGVVYMKSTSCYAGLGVVSGYDSQPKSFCYFKPAELITTNLTATNKRGREGLELFAGIDAFITAICFILLGLVAICILLCVLQGVSNVRLHHNEVISQTHNDNTVESGSHCHHLGWILLLTNAVSSVLVI